MRLTWLIILIFLQQLLLAQPGVTILNNNTDIVVDMTKIKKNIYCEILFNNGNSDQYSTVKIPYSNLIKISNITASIEDVHGKVIKKLKNSDIQTCSNTSNGAFFDDNMLKRFTLKHNIYPYILKYSYESTESEFIDIAYWTPCYDLNVPVMSARLKIDAPINYAIKYQNREIIFFHADTTADKVSYCWQTAYCQPIQHEIYSPDELAILPLVKVFPENFKYYKQGSFTNWATFGNWQYEINKDKQQLTLQEINNLKQITSSITDSLTLLKTLYHYLEDNTRYINVSIATGGFVPFPAEYVIANKYGDCKALSNYFQAILTYYGFKSHYTEVYASKKINHTEENFSCPQFNHIILCVPFKKDTIWLDCTSHGPFAYLGTFTQGRKAFIIDQNKSRLVNIPALKKNDVENHREIIFSNFNNVNCNAKVNKTFRGDDFESLLSMHTEVSSTDLDTYIRTSFVENCFEPDSIHLIKKDRDSTSIDLTYSAVSNTIVQKYGNDFVLKPLSIATPKLDKPSLRTNDLQMNYPIYETDCQHYFLKGSTQSIVLPKEQLINSKYGLFKSVWTRISNGLQLKQSLFISSVYLKKKDYAEFYNFIDSVLETEKNNNLIITDANK